MDEHELFGTFKPTDKKITWLSSGRKAQCAPNPQYPHGIDVDNGIRPACLVKLPYPADCCGTWLIECEACGCRTGVTAAGRPDDPKSVMVPCKENRSDR